MQETADGLVIDGTGGEPLRGTAGGEAVTTLLDHRIAMSMAVAGMASLDGVLVDDMRPVATSFPGFAELLEGLAGNDSRGYAEARRCFSARKGAEGAKNAVS